MSPSPLPLHQPDCPRSQQALSTVTQTRIFDSTMTFHGDSARLSVSSTPEPSEEVSAQSPVQVEDPSQDEYYDSGSEEEDCPIPPEAVERPIEFETLTSRWFTALEKWNYWHQESHPRPPGSKTPSFSVVNVDDESGQRLLSFPLDFLLAGGVARVGYLVEMVHLAFEEPGFLLWPQTDEAAQPGDAISGPTIFLFVRNDGIKDSCTPLPGPHFRFPFGLIQSEGPFYLDKGERAKQEASQTPALIQLHETIRNRDKMCVFMDIDHHCLDEVFPIVALPVDEDVAYEEDIDQYTDHERFPRQFSHPSPCPSAYLTGWCIWRKLWSLGLIALYPCSQGYVIHCFMGPNELDAPLHGKLIPRQRFNCADEHLPDPSHLRFHYQQCIMKAARAFSAGPLPCHPTTLRWAMHDSDERFRGEYSKPRQDHAELESRKRGGRRNPFDWPRESSLACWP